MEREPKNATAGPLVVSVVTVTWQAGDVVGRTLQSVLEQTHAGVEHIVVDGGSTDSTLTQVFDYQRRSAQARNGHTVSVVSEPDHGIYDAMQKGLDRATGDYVLFMNAGDTFCDADTLAAVCAVAQAAGRPGVVYGDTDLVDADGHRLGARRLRPPERLTWRSFRHGMLVCHQAFYARRDVARRQPYDQRYRYSADVDWCIRVMKDCQEHGLPLANARRVVARYLNEGQTTRHHRASLEERFRVMSTHYGLATTVLMHAWFALRSLFK